MNNDKEITLHERKKREEDQDDFGVAKRFLQQMNRKEEEHIEMKREDECFEILPKVAAMEYLEHMKRKGNISYENGISEEVAIEKETKLDENNGKTTGRQQGDNGETTEKQQGDNRETTGRQQGDNGETTEKQQGDNRETTGRQQGDNGETTEKQQGDNRETTGRQQGDNVKTTEKQQGDNRETTGRQQGDNGETTEKQQGDNRETTGRQKGDNGETTEKQQGEIGGANSLDILKQEIPRKDEMLFSFDPMNTYSKLLINGVNKENANTNTLLKEIVNELMGTKKKVVFNSSSMENVRGIRSDSASNYCILRNIDTGFFHHSNSETAMKLNHFYTKIRKFSNSPFERMIEYWEDSMGIKFMDEDINDNETDNVGLDCEILNGKNKKISGDTKRENIQVTTVEPLKEIQDTSAVSGLRQLLKSNKSDYDDESVSQYLRMRNALEDPKVIL